ncbi:chromate efflux transporter [Nocardioides sp. TRM66260-LWL]|uniref:chromate efflux transporter n=1 Tax=Nocardioides sp. TRM66260-LWL TaxID=2874478 RepID=UPI001CC541DA|nr:chromate efflux transporter [Nocardioides sp. TRM66260-LWL]MBZ5735043.1 chromate efflux transporter [Nocardioides sp. TRM66260-LWL]
MSPEGGPDAHTGRGSAREVLAVFLRLGLTSFGGPVAHLGYFRDALVVRRRWLGEQAYADVVALCQLLPGPASSQVGMALGLQRAGLLGMLAAWVGFTLPSALALGAFALVVARSGDLAGAGWIDGLKAAAVAVVVQAVLGMARSLTPDARRAAIGVVTLLLAVLLPGAATQVLLIVGAGLLGLVLLRPLVPSGTETDLAPLVEVPRRLAVGCLGLFAALLVVLPLVGTAFGGLAELAAIFYRAGALVFGGGHVVLPLLQSDLVDPGLVDRADFLAGYGATQAVPGPLFTFAAFLGSLRDGVLGGVVATLAIFLPAALLVLGALPFWQRLRTSAPARSALMGVNAAVVGLLAAALYDPVLSEGVTSWRAALLALAAYLVLERLRCPPWGVVVGAALVGAVLL